MQKLSIKSQILAVEDEIAQRHKVYGRLVSLRKMKQGEADYKINAMICVKSTLEFCQEHEAAIRTYMAKDKGLI